MDHHFSRLLAAWLVRRGGSLGNGALGLGGLLLAQAGAGGELSTGALDVALVDALRAGGAAPSIALAVGAGLGLADGESLDAGLGQDVAGDGGLGLAGLLLAQAGAGGELGASAVDVALVDALRAVVVAGGVAGAVGAGLGLADGELLHAGVGAGGGLGGEGQDGGSDSEVELHLVDSGKGSGGRKSDLGRRIKKLVSEVLRWK